MVMLHSNNDHVLCFFSFVEEYDPTIGKLWCDMVTVSDPIHLVEFIWGIFLAMGQ